MTPHLPSPRIFTADPTLRAIEAQAWPDYAELHCLSAFSFQRGASVAKELFERAHALGYRALAITDECSLAGIVRAFEASQETGLPLIVGSEVRVEDGPKLVLLVATQAGYTALCGLITDARRRAPKGEYRLLREDFDRPGLDGLLALWVPGEHELPEINIAPPVDASALTRPSVKDCVHAERGKGAGPMAPQAGLPPAAKWLHHHFPGRAWLAVELHHGPDDATRLQRLLDLARCCNLPAVATGDAHMHVRRRRALQDTLTAIRHRCTLAEAGAHLFPNGERHLRTRNALAAIHPAELLRETLRIAERCTFTMDQLRYEYPRELVPEGETPTSWLRQLVTDGIPGRWPEGPDQETRDKIEYELALIAKLDYESYFLTVHDIVRFARSRGILCQGRGSAANSVVCYALGVTAIDPVRGSMLIERFISVERNEPPDIDIDFEHERREEVLQYVFERYGRGRAALTAVAISYRGRSAIRDVAKVLGLPPDQVNELAATMDRWGGRAPIPEYLRERGFDPDSPLMQRVIALTAELIDFPRHLSQHPGGFVISEHPLSTLVPVENAAMDNRTVIQWDKNDLDTMGLMKVDCLALGMLTAIRKTLDLLRRHDRGDYTLATIPTEDKTTYEMISRADTVGVFQIESRAQMAMLPRLRPRSFYDLVIQVAIVRPGPIQGDMVHPYLRRRNGEEPIDYPPKLEKVFARTLGVPLFQEQVMQLAIVGADYTGGEADKLRRDMAAWQRRGGLEPHREKLTAGLLRNGFSLEYAERIFSQIKGFGEYGFPESHAASFALLSYASSWLKCHEGAAFTCSLINSLPMGFYSADQLLQDARRHRIRVLPVDVRYSEWDCTLEFSAHTPSSSVTRSPGIATMQAASHDPSPAIRLGLRMVQGFSENAALQLHTARQHRAFTDVDDLCRRAALDEQHRSLLADAGALKALSGHRHRARWAIAGVEPQLPLFADAPPTSEHAIALPMPTAGEDLTLDYATTGTTLGRHPLAMIRKALVARRCKRSSELEALPHGRRVRTAGLVTLRQRPATASGVTFMSLEDEDGTTNVVVWRHLAERQRRVFLESRLLVVEGRLERQDGVQHLIAERLQDASELLGTLATGGSRDFH
ncbi:error-prone DNA polymerase [Aerolutibacter ruishenii]|uniref:Error-prone DNA polymerase n=1 Tax=Aerolutibacter ruishenii TaxID=686800 RepID=A0A562LVL7_9GAMM|nr:error-prone DNA polymerase [Lysobacter ruishenii]TWI11558.1 error-prone DNA polymerase [Lysobacter ruishenii]